MTNIAALKSALDWKLLHGSHDFPGPDGGTCINEAAIVAAGFKYQAVRRPSDMPPCFSQVVSMFAMGLNDSIPTAWRDEMLQPYVMQLAGTRDTIAVERARAEYIALAVVKHFLPLAGVAQIGEVSTPVDIDIQPDPTSPYLWSGSVHGTLVMRQVGTSYPFADLAPQVTDLLSFLAIVKRLSLMHKEARFSSLAIDTLRPSNIYNVVSRFVEHKDHDGVVLVDWATEVIRQASFTEALWPHSKVFLAQDSAKCRRREVFVGACILLGEAIRLGRHQPIDMAEGAERLAACPRKLEEGVLA